MLYAEQKWVYMLVESGLHAIRRARVDVRVCAGRSGGIDPKANSTTSSPTPSQGKIVHRLRPLTLDRLHAVSGAGVGVRACRG